MSHNKLIQVGKPHTEPQPLQVAADEHKDIHERLYALQLAIVTADPELKFQVQSEGGLEQLQAIEELARLALCYRPTCYATWDMLASELRLPFYAACLRQSPAFTEASPFNLTSLNVRFSLWHLIAKKQRVH